MRAQITNKVGFSLVGVLASIGVVGVLLPSLFAAMGGSATTFTSKKTGTWTAAVQSQVDQLVDLGYHKISSDSATVDGFPMNWSVEGTDPKVVTITVDRGLPATNSAVDTLVLIFPATDSLAGAQP